MARGTGNGHSRRSQEEHAGGNGPSRTRQIIGRAREAATNIYEYLDIEGRVDRNPYGMLAAAVGIGFVLGGGLASRLARKLFGLGAMAALRFVALPMLQEELVGYMSRAGAEAKESGAVR